MSNARIEHVKAATALLAAYVPVSAASGIPMDWTYQVPAYRNLFMPVQNGTALQSGQVTEITNMAAGSSNATPQRVTAAEDRWLRRAAVNSSRMVAHGRLINRSA